MNYRRIWENHNGPIPTDELGRSYEIHHIDGNRNNNTIGNLQCVSLEEHYLIHLSQGDYHAAKMIKNRVDNIQDFPAMPEEQRNQIRDRMLGDKNPMKRPEVAKKVSNALKGRRKSPEAEKKRLESRKDFKHSEKTLEKMRKPKTKLTCPHCTRVGGDSQMKRWHFSNCKNIRV